jgi:hypothetical protein
LDGVTGEENMKLVRAGAIAPASLNAASITSHWLNSQGRRCHLTDSFLLTGDAQCRT